MILLILEKLDDLLTKTHRTIISWRLKWKFRNFKPKINYTRLEVDQIDMGNMGRWQASDDGRRPPAHTSADVGSYNRTEPKK